MSRILRALIVITIVFLTTNSTSSNAYATRPDAHAPIGVMGDHTHKKGEIMLSYRYMFMSMDGSRDGNSSIGDLQVLGNFMITPTDMDTQMHMFGLMYAPTDNITVMGMLPYIKLSMNHITRTGTRFKTTSEGIGDMKVVSLYKFFNNKKHNLIFNMGISFPTGSIDEEDDTPAESDQQLPYPMQLGSGTFDLLPGITYAGHHNILSWGSQITGTIRLGENDRDYTLGNRIDLTTWGVVNIIDWISLSGRLNWDFWGNIDGADPELNPDVVATADPDRRGGNRLDVLLGLNFINQKGPKLIKGHRFAIEFGFPVYQDLDGPQLETDWILTFGWQYAFANN